MPNYATLCRRVQALMVQLPIIHDGEANHLMVNSTGVKASAQGEWKVRQHGNSKRRVWRQVPLALDANPTRVHAALMMRQDVTDGAILAELVDQTPDVRNVIGGDAAYDCRPCRAATPARDAALSIPPCGGAAHWPANTSGTRGGATTRPPNSSTANGSRPVVTIDSLAENATYRLKTLTGNPQWAC